jgi:signal transduction histidine kinase
LEIELFASQVAAIVRPKAEGRGIAYHVDIASDLGSMEMDEMAMSAALVNFLENSVDACSDDLHKEHHEITFRVRSEGEDIVYEIIDNGIGMEQETKEKMFTLFFSSKGAKGTGLGLYISNQVVEQHGGRITVESEIGVGTTTTVIIPRQRAATTAGDGHGEIPAAPSSGFVEEAGRDS